MAMKSLSDLFVHFLRDIYYAEKQGVKEMRAMGRKASSPELKQLIEQHRDETEQQVEMLEQVFEQLGLRARGVKCEAMEGIASEAHEIMEEAEEGQTRDCGIVAAIQAVEHYEITRYGTLVAWAKALGHDEAVPLLEQIRDQEVMADEKLSALAEQTLNPDAEPGDVEEADAEAGDEDESEEVDVDEVDPEEVDEEELDDDAKAAKAELEAMDEELDDAEAEGSGGGAKGRGKGAAAKKAPSRGGKKS